MSNRAVHASLLHSMHTYGYMAEKERVPYNTNSQPIEQKYTKYEHRPACGSGSNQSASLAISRLPPDSNGEGYWIIWCVQLLQCTQVLTIFPPQIHPIQLAARWRKFYKEHCIRLGWMQSKKGEVVDNVPQSNFAVGRLHKYAE